MMSRPDYKGYIDLLGLLFRAKFLETSDPKKNKKLILPGVNLELFLFWGQISVFCSVSGSNSRVRV